MFILPEDVPEEVRQQIELASMAIQDTRHRVLGLITDADKETLLSIKIMLDSIIESGGQVMAAHLSGICAAHLSIKYKVCSSCARDHERDAMEELADMTETAKKEPTSLIDTDALKKSMLSEEDELDSLIQHVYETDEYDFTMIEEIRASAGKPPTTSFQREMMATLNLDDAWDGFGPDDPEKIFEGYRCLGCGQLYSSIADRAMKAADECQGCMLKAAHG